MELSDKIKRIALEHSFATTAKESARARIQCSLEEWKEVQVEAKRLYQERQAKKAVDLQKHHIE